ncbi:MAG: hypothetical protein M0R80_18325 [Proteobacteria bacterium]|jgi:hypothetical protein|nr:hypothetical protein [Pseudomonadota bacterium]
MADATKINLGICSVSINGTDIGHTKGGVEVTYKPEFSEISVDLYGGSIVDKRLKAEDFQVKVPLAEYTLANLKKVIPSGDLVESGGKTALKIGRQAGYSLLNEAQRLVLHPVSREASDISFDVIVWKAVQIGEIKLGFNDSETIMEAQYQAFIDESKANKNYLATIGDSTI